ncbi:Hypothetical protein POVR1_LOCUS498 [uncultured virus]|nr:Hypothetical protein POVR1_LOCUS498 [uncultured virus]
MSYYIYVLILEGDKYFIGRTIDVIRRMYDHQMGQAGDWTRRYKPLGAERIIENTSASDLEKVYQEYVKKFGSDNVRKDEY